MNCPRCGEANSLATADQTPDHYSLCRRCSGYSPTAVVCRKCESSWCPDCYRRSVAERQAGSQVRPPKLGGGMGDENFSI